MIKLIKIDSVKTMRLSIITAVFLIVPLHLSYSAYGASGNRDGQAFAQSCVLIKSPNKRNYLGRSRSGKFHFAYKRSQATRFYIKPTELGRYMLMDDRGQFLSLVKGFGPAGKAYAALNPAEFRSIWKMTSEDGKLFSLENNERLKITHSYWETKRIRFWKKRYVVTETEFAIERTRNCRDFPEITTNANVDVNSLKSEAGDNIRGFVDAHTHIASTEIQGGRFMHGRSFHPLGVGFALSDQSNTHGKITNRAIGIANASGFTSQKPFSSTKGWPDFESWPKRDVLNVTGYYYKWIVRSYLSGQRMVVSYMTGMQVPCKIVTNRILDKIMGPFNEPAKSCDTMNTLDRQIRLHYELQDYIDAQFGGPGRGFFRIATTPEQARGFIQEGKLAVLLGVEISEVLDCGLKDKVCTQQSINRDLMHLYNQGVRAMFIGHKFDTQLTGVVYETFPVDIGNRISSGDWFEVQSCPAGALNPRAQDHTTSTIFRPNNDLASAVADFFEPIPVLRKIIPWLQRLLVNVINLRGYPEYDYLSHNTDNHTDDSGGLSLPCNTRGLTELGSYLVNKMMDLKMIIDIDHLSDISASTVLDIAEARNYGSMVSSHSYLHVDDDSGTGGLGDSMRRLLRLGGFVSPMGNKRSDELGVLISEIADEMSQTNSLVGVGIGTDMSGIATQAPARQDADNNPLTYPFETEFGGVFDRQTSGNRTFDLNKDGIAHYGMVADYIQDIRVNADHNAYEALMNSAEAYLRMWKLGDTAYAGHVLPQGSL